MSTIKDINNDLDLSTENPLNYKKQIVNYVAVKIPFGLIPGIFGMVYIYFFWDFLGLDDNLFNIGMIIYGFFNALNDPLLGQMSDRVDIQKWGSRRLIFIKYGGPIWAVIFFLMWIPWSYNNQILIFLHFVISLVFFDNMLTLVILVWDALLPEIAENHEDRNKIFFWGGVIGTLASIPVLFALSIMQKSLLNFQIFSGFIAILSAVIFYVTASNMKERPELHYEANTPGLFSSLVQCFKSRGFVTFTLYRFFKVINETMIFSFIFVYVYLFPPGFETILLVLLTLAGILGQWIYVKLSEKFEMQKIIMWGRLFEIIISIVAFFISIQENTEIIWYGLFFVKILLGGNVVFMNPYLLLVADEDEMKFDTRREGMFLGTNAIFNKIAESVGPILAVAVLGYFGFVNNAPEDYFPSENTIFGIKFLLFIVPSIIDLLGMIALHFYPIKDERLTNLKTFIEEAHQKKKIDFLERKNAEFVKDSLE